MGVKFNVLERGNSIFGQPLALNKTYKINKDTCRNDSTFYLVSCKDSHTNGSTYSYRVSLFLDSIHKKIYVNRLLDESLARGILLYDFNLNIGDTNQYGYIVQKIDTQNIIGVERRIFYFVKSNTCINYNDIWVENFGSIVLDLLDPRDRCESDGMRYSINERINIGNIWELIGSIDMIPHSNFSNILLESHADLGFQYISIQCSGDRDTVMPAYNKCISDTNFHYSSQISVNSGKKYQCLDTIFYSHVLDARRLSNKVVKWMFSKDTIVDFPRTKNGKASYFNAITVSNSDNSCFSYRQTPTIRPNCKYCDNPKKKIIASVELNKNSFQCLDTIMFSFNIAGGDSLKSINWINNPIQIIQYPSSLVDNKEYFNTLSVENAADSSCNVLVSHIVDNIMCKYCDNPIHNPTLTLISNKDTFCRDTLRYSISSSGLSDSLWVYHTPAINYNQIGAQKIRFHFGNRHCVNNVQEKSIFIKCSSSSILQFDSSSIDIYPNPVSMKINIHVKDVGLINKGFNCSLINKLGIAVFKGVIKETHLRIPVESLSSGLYYILIKDNAGEIIKKTSIAIKND